MTYHYSEKLGLFTEEEFLSELNIGFLSTSKSKFRDHDQNFWLGKTPGNSNPNLTPNQKNNTAKYHLQIQFGNLKLVRYKYFVFPFEVLIKILIGEVSLYN